MARHTPQARLDLARVSEERQGLITLLEEAIAIIEAADEPDCEAWLGQARATLAKCGGKS
jgi:hypothetical protein